VTTWLSVVIPVKDGSQYLGEAVTSALGQRPRPGEVIVVDDGSSDDSAAVAAAFGDGVQVIPAVGRGAAAARNTGVAAARGEMIAFLDADDRWTAAALSHLVLALKTDDDAVLSHGRVREFRSPELSPSIAARLEPRPGAPHGVISGSFLFIASIFDQVGPLDTDLRAGEVVDWLARLRVLGMKETSTEAVVLERRLHAGHLRPHKREAQVDLIRVVRAGLDRQRPVPTAP